MANFLKSNNYFPHDSNAKDDPKCVMLIESLNPEGYGIFWILVEILKDQPFYKYPINLIPSIARKYNTTSDKVKAVVFNYNLFEIDQENFFYSNSLINRMYQVYDKKLKQSEGGKKAMLARWNKDKTEKSDKLVISNLKDTYKLKDKLLITNKRKEKKIKEIKEDSNSFLIFSKIKTNFPIINYSENEIVKACETIRLLIEIDKFTEIELIQITSQIKEHWYGANIQSINSLRAKKDGVMKINKLKNYLESDKKQGAKISENQTKNKDIISSYQFKIK